MLWFKKPADVPSPEDALPGRDEEVVVPERHFINGRPMKPPFPEGFQKALFGMGCFWGPERMFWQLEGVYTTVVGYAGGYTPNPTYQEVCSGLTGQNEVVLIVFDPEVTSYETLLKVFWESHDPTQGMRQGNDVGTQYRSEVYAYDEAQKSAAIASLKSFQVALTNAGYGTITTTVVDAPAFYYGEDFHQQFLAKNPGGYCGMGGTGVSCPAGILENA